MSKSKNPQNKELGRRLALKAKQIKESYAIVKTEIKNLKFVFATPKEKIEPHFDNPNFAYTDKIENKHYQGLEAYNQLMKRHTISEKRREQVRKLLDYIEKEGPENFYFLAKFGAIKRLDRVKDIFACITFDFIQDFDVYAGERNGYSVGEAENRNVVVVVLDKRTDEIITEYTDFKELEIIKEVQKTKIIKQEVKSGIDKNKIEKAIKKALTDTNRLASKKMLSMDNPAMQEELVKNILQRLG